MTTHLKMKLLCLTILLVTVSHIILPELVKAEQCNSNSNVYGKNEIIDQLMLCALSRNFDLDLTPQGNHIKNTPKILIEQGFSNKTTILYARLSGLWSAKRVDLVETGWRCDANRTLANTLIEVNGLALEVVERLEIHLHRNQQKLVAHKPCKTFDLPLWLCRQSKPIYRTTKTWVNSAYFNLTLTQEASSNKPQIDQLDFVFTCPETFKQKITHSPSAMYILSKYMQTQDSEISQPTSSSDKLSKREISNSGGGGGGLVEKSIGHPSSYSSSQSGKQPASPPYHSSVNLIINQAVTMLKTSLNDCLQNLDLDLTLSIIDHDLFNRDRYSHKLDQPAAWWSKKSSGYSGEPKDEEISKDDDDDNKDEFLAKNQCSNKRWIVNRIELAEMANSFDEDGEHEIRPQDANHLKRSQFMLNYPQNPNQLLNPYGYYHESADHMIDDVEERN